MRLTVISTITLVRCEIGTLSIKDNFCSRGQAREERLSERHIWNGGKAILNQHIFKVEFDQIRATKIYLLYALNRAVAEVEQNLHGGVGLVHITKGNLERIQIPIPPLTTQQALVAEIEAEQSLVAANRELVERMEGKIRAAIGRVWGDE